MNHRKVLFIGMLSATISMPVLAAGSAGFSVNQERYQGFMQKLEAGVITPLGSLRAGNQAGIIPAWNCENGVPADITVPAAIKDAHRFPAFKQFPFMEEDPRFVVTSGNYEKYKDKLSPGTIKRLKSYPNEFRIPGLSEPSDRLLSGVRL